MGTMKPASPFGPPVAEIPLDPAPLAFVVAQVRFPAVLSISQSSFVGQFQEYIRADYPVLRQERQAQIALGPDGPSARDGGLVWRFDQADGPWQVTLADNFVALSTQRYTSRADFLARLGTVVNALMTWISPAKCERLGVRYVCRVTDAAVLERLPELIEPSVLGVAALAELGDDRVSRDYALVDASFSHADGSALRGRWGLLPANGTFDVNVEPIDVPSWVLDLDVYTTAWDDFAPNAILERARAFCERQYRMFRWAVTDDFLRAFGGQP